MVSIPSLHFFRWTAQLQDSDHEVYWFDISGMSDKVERINWVTQKTSWKLRWDYPGRTFIKSKLPIIYRWIQKINDRDTAKVFEDYLNEIKPDVVHSFAMQLSCIPILNIMQEYKAVKWIYSSWGSDMYYSKELKIDKIIECEVLNRLDYLITDCERDYEIAIEKGYKNNFLGVLPGNGGVHFGEENILSFNHRKIILIKAYNDSIGKGLNIFKAFNYEHISLVKDFEIIIFGADLEVKSWVESSLLFHELRYRIFLKDDFIDNEELLKIMGRSLIYIGNSISDGLPNTLIEAMGMGAFPIQSNPGNVSEELIKDKFNGLLIRDPLDSVEISEHISFALKNTEILQKGLYYNVDLIRKKYDRDLNKKVIHQLYDSIV